MVFLHSGARDFDLGGGFQHSGNYPMMFLHSGARDFDLGGGFQHSGNYPMVFLHSVPPGIHTERTVCVSRQYAYSSTRREPTQVRHAYDTTCDVQL